MKHKCFLPCNYFVLTWKLNFSTINSYFETWMLFYQILYIVFNLPSVRAGSSASLTYMVKAAHRPPPEDAILEGFMPLPKIQWSVWRESTPVPIIRGCRPLNILHGQINLFPHLSIWNMEVTSSGEALPCITYAKCLCSIYILRQTFLLLINFNFIIICWSL